jgi:hypothetical protein
MGSPDRQRRAVGGCRAACVAGPAPRARDGRNPAYIPEIAVDESQMRIQAVDILPTGKLFD